MEATPPIVGIDLGTTNSALAVFREDDVVFIPNALGDVLTPSAVAWDERSKAILVGRTAKDIAAVHPRRAALLFKRSMGTDQTYKVGPRELGAVACSALILQALREDARRALGPDVDTCVITVPAYFNEAQRFATQQAGELAGWTVKRVLNEPTAAAIAHGLHRLTTDATLAVIDLGGGTFDVCIMDRFEGALEVRSVAGESRLGGEDFTRRIAGLALEQAGLVFETVEMRDPEAVATLTRRAELLKRAWCATPDTGDPLRIDVPQVGTYGGGEITLSREHLREAVAPLVDRLKGPVRASLRGGGLNGTDIDEVLLVGGATRMPVVREFVERLLGREPRTGIDPDLAVVAGAAIQGALYLDGSAVGDLVVTDVASHSLGIATAKVLGRDYKAGYFLPIIHRNTVIPTSRTEEVSTIVPNQTEMTLDVYEGESRRVSENRLIGTLIVKGIPRGPEGQVVRVTFTFDLNGILEVEATVKATGTVVRQVFQRNGESLSPQALADVARRFAKLKRDPAETPRVRDLLARAEALLQDLTAERRLRLEDALDGFERALYSRVPEEIEAWGTLLENLCESIDRGDRW